VTKVDQILKRQAQWQKSQQQLTWPEKIRMAEQVRESVVALRRSASAGERRESPGSTGPQVRTDTDPTAD